MFELTQEQSKQLSEWIARKDLTKYGGACGGRFTYSFTPTSLGLIIIVTDDLDKENPEVDLTDYEW